MYTYEADNELAAIKKVKRRRRITRKQNKPLTPFERLIKLYCSDSNFKFQSKSGS